MSKKIFFSKPLFLCGFIDADNREDAFEKIKKINFNELSKEQFKELKLNLCDAKCDPLITEDEKHYRLYLDKNGVLKEEGIA